MSTIFILYFISNSTNNNDSSFLTYHRVSNWINMMGANSGEGGTPYPSTAPVHLYRLLMDHKNDHLNGLLVNHKNDHLYELLMDHKNDHLYGLLMDLKK
jgi:hypothetical protein